MKILSQRKVLGGHLQEAFVKKGFGST